MAIVAEEKRKANNEVALSTVDNPYDPFTQWDEWYTFDETKGYCSCGYLSRIADTSPDMSDEWNQQEIERAIDEIVRIDPFGIYIKVYKNPSMKGEE